jgi:hypothetical protein
VWAGARFVLVLVPCCVGCGGICNALQRAEAHLAVPLGQARVDCLTTGADIVEHGREPRKRSQPLGGRPSEPSRSKGRVRRPAGVRRLLVHRSWSCYQPAMSWWPESGLLRTVLDAKSSVYASVTLACTAIVVLAVVHVPYLRMLPGLVLAIVASVGLLTFALFLGRMWELGHECWQEHRRRRAVLARLDTLNTSERQVLTDQAERNEQTFYDAIHDPVVAGLERKGLVLRPAIGSPLRYSYTIPDLVWSELRRRWEAEGKPEARSDGLAARRPPRAQRR